MRENGVKLIEEEREVVNEGGKEEKILGKSRIEEEVEEINEEDMRKSEVDLIDEKKRIVGNILKKGRRRIEGFEESEIERIILDE